MRNWIQLATSVFITALVVSCAVTPEMEPDIGSVMGSEFCDGEREGSVREGYVIPLTSGDIPCTTGVQTCVNGAWVGPKLYDICKNHTKSCDGIPHGHSKNGFLHATAMPGLPCQPATNTCVDGNWVGPLMHDTCVNSTKSCGAAHHGTIEEGYAQPTAFAGQPCQRISRTCVDGAWVGPTILHPHCQEAP